jgi:hypothetical protein
MTFAALVEQLWKGLGTLWKGRIGNVQNAETGPLPYTSPINFSIATGWTGYKVEDNPQEMTLNRMIFTDKSTLGELWLDGKLFCYTLEPTCRAHQKPAPEHLAIPAKRYLVNVQYSNKFGKKMPTLVDVPDRTHILIHPGNFPSDTEGCLLVGQTKGVDYIGESRAAFDRLWPIILERADNRMLFLTILGGGISNV